jgi:hypothetical protein
MEGNHLVRVRSDSPKHEICPLDFPIVRGVGDERSDRNKLLSKAIN